MSDIANGVKKLPREWINEDGVSMNFQFLRYAQPLIQGEVTIPHDSGVPVFAHPLARMRGRVVRDGLVVIPPCRRPDRPSPPGPNRRATDGAAQPKRPEM